MDWLQRMNRVIAHIEDHLTERIELEILARIAGCSAYEFSRLFSFITGIPVSEYIRRRRLSQAALDLQCGSGKIIDIALKYGYDSPTAFTKAFRVFHGVSPTGARTLSTPMKLCPPLCFTLSIKGREAVEYRIARHNSFRIVGLSGYDSADCAPGDTLTPLWRRFMDEYDPLMHYSAPYWQIGAYNFASIGGKIKTIIGAEYQGQSADGLTIETIPATTWAVFSFHTPTGIDYVPAAYTRILTEWFPNSPYQRDESIPHLEVFPAGNIHSPEYTWEIWIPVKDR